MMDGIRRSEIRKRNVEDKYDSDTLYTCMKMS